MSHTAALGTDPRTTTDSLDEAGRAGIEPRASLEFNRRATNVKKCFVSSKSRRVPMPSDSASEPTRVNLIRPAPSRDAIDRERVYGAGRMRLTRVGSLAESDGVGTWRLLARNETFFSHLWRDD